MEDKISHEFPKEELILKIANFTFFLSFLIYFHPDVLVNGSEIEFNLVIEQRNVHFVFFLYFPLQVVINLFDFS